jgi:hypothetical protein
MARYHRITLPRAAPGAHRHAQHEGACMLQKLLVRVTDATADVGEDTDESYLLTLPSPASVFHAAALRCEGPGLVGKLRAKTAVGAYRGLETFSQLVAFGTRVTCFTSTCFTRGIPGARDVFAARRLWYSCYLLY